jgi:hypothetical protein
VGNPIKKKECLQEYMKVNSPSLSPSYMLGNLTYRDPLQGLEEFKKTGDDIAFGFTRLCQGIESFQKLLARNAKAELGRVQARVQEIDEKIKKLESDVSMLVPSSSSCFRVILSFRSADRAVRCMRYSRCQFSPDINITPGFDVQKHLFAWEKGG